MDKELHLKKLAGIAGVSPYYFHREFKSLTGETLYDFIQRKRLERACFLLSSNSEIKIIDIAYQCSFSTPSSFSKAFKTYYMTTPSEYRKRKPFQNSKNGTHKSNFSKDLISPVEYISEEELIILHKRRNNLNIKVENLPSYRIAYMRNIGPYGSSNISVLQKLKKWAMTKDLISQSTIMLGIAHDDPAITPPEKCRYDTGIVISEDCRLDSNVIENRLSEGLYAVLQVDYHTVEAMRQAWEKVSSDWLPLSGYEVDERPFIERYTGAAIDTEIKPITCEICLPIKH